MYSIFNLIKMPWPNLSGISWRFHQLSQALRQVAYVLLTRSPLSSKEQAPLHFVRLACIRHAASVHPEPGSNSPFDSFSCFNSDEFCFFFIVWNWHFLFSFQRTNSLAFRLTLVHNTNLKSLCQHLFSFIFIYLSDVLLPHDNPCQCIAFCPFYPVFIRFSRLSFPHSHPLLCNHNLFPTIQSWRSVDKIALISGGFTFCIAPFPGPCVSSLIRHPFTPLISISLSSGHNTQKKDIRMNVLINWQWAIFTSAGLDIVAAKVLNFCVRDGNRCDHFATITRSYAVRENLSKLNNRKTCFFFFSNSHIFCD